MWNKLATNIHRFCTFSISKIHFYRHFPYWYMNFCTCNICFILLSVMSELFLLCSNLQRRQMYMQVHPDSFPRTMLHAGQGFVMVRHFLIDHCCSSYFITLSCFTHFHPFQVHPPLSLTHFIYPPISHSPTHSFIHIPIVYSLTHPSLSHSSTHQLITYLF